MVYIKCIRETTEEGKKSSQEVSGSGVIISPQGELISNWHVADKAVSLRCLLYDGQALEADIVGIDKDIDLALIKLRRPADAPPLPYAAIGDSTALVEGDFVMAMGAPWGLSRSVSIGIVSCTRRFLEGQSQYSLWLQTDAAISPGNSGGPLVNTHGEVIGINTLGTNDGGDMGFAIPSETISRLLPLLREHKAVPWSWSGLQLQALRDFNRNIYFDATEGVIVSGTDPHSPAREAGLQTRDRIVKLNDQPLNAISEEDLPRVRMTLGLLPRDQAYTLEVVRGTETLKVSVTPREKGRVEGQELECPRWDLSLKEINQFDNPDLFFHRRQGVYIFGVKQPGNASSAGLNQQDILLKVGKEEVGSLDDAKRLHQATLKNVAQSHRLVLTVLRNGLIRQVALDISRDYEKD